MVKRSESSRRKSLRPIVPSTPIRPNPPPSHSDVDMLDYPSEFSELHIQHAEQNTSFDRHNTYYESFSTGNINETNNFLGSRALGTPTNLSRPRQLSPFVQTPSTSFASPEPLDNITQYYPNIAQSHPNNGSWAQRPSTVPTTSSQITYSTVPGVNSPLQFHPHPTGAVANAANVTPSYETRHAAFVSSPQLPLSTNHPRYPSFSTALSGLPMRHEPLESRFKHYRSPSSPSVNSLSSPTDSIETTGRRKGPLSTEQRQNANRVRRVGACLRCIIMRETCDTDNSTCNRCCTKLRKWKLGCRRSRLENHVDMLVPELLRHRLDSQSVNAFISNFGQRQPNSAPFKIRLDLRLSSTRALEVLVKEIHPLEANRLIQPGFIPSTDDSVPFYKMIPVHSPPIAPYVSNEHTEQIKKQLRTWFDLVLDMPELTEGTEDTWPWPCFPVVGVEEWLAEMVEAIYKYYARDREGRQMLKHVLYLPFLMFILMHKLLIPENEVAEVYRKIENPRYHAAPPSGDISPILISRYIKSWVLPWVNQIARESLTQLHKFLQSSACGKEIAEREDVFCLAFVILYTLGRMQEHLLDIAAEAQQDTQSLITYRQIEDLIEEMETKLADYIIHFHEYCVQKRTPKDSDTRMADQEQSDGGLMGNFAQITQQYFHLKPKSFHVRDALRDRDQFRGQNTQRLCWKYYIAVVGP